MTSGVASIFSWWVSFLLRWIVGWLGWLAAAAAAADAEAATKHVPGKMSGMVSVEADVRIRGSLTSSLFFFAPKILWALNSFSLWHHEVWSTFPANISLLRRSIQFSPWEIDFFPFWHQWQRLDEILFFYIDCRGCRGPSTTLIRRCWGLIFTKTRKWAKVRRTPFALKKRGTVLKHATSR